MKAVRWVSVSWLAVILLPATAVFGQSPVVLNKAEVIFDITNNSGNVAMSMDVSLWGPTGKRLAHSGTVSARRNDNLGYVVDLAIDDAAAVRNKGNIQLRVALHQRRISAFTLKGHLGVTFSDGTFSTMEFGRQTTSPDGSELVVELGSLLNALIAGEVTKTLSFTTSEAIQVPTKVLPAGKYVIKMLKFPSDTIQIFNGDETELQTTFAAIPNHTPQPTSKSDLTFWETPPGEPKALRAWMTTGDNVAHEFAYPITKATQIASYAHQSVPSVPEGKGSAPVLNNATVQVFFATDRLEIQPGRFGIDPAPNDAMTEGIAKVSIPHDHRMGEIEQPLWYKWQFKEDPNLHVVVVSITDRKEPAFFNDMQTLVRQSKGKEALIFIHGFNETFDEALKRTAQIAYDLKFDGVPIMYSWPSAGQLNPVAYIRDQRNADLSAYHLAAFLRKVRENSGATKVEIIAHSMGNRVLASALEQLFSDTTFKPVPAFQHIALMAPDIDAEQFKHLANAMKSMAAQVTLYCSSRDEALAYAQKYAGYPRAGQPLVVVPGIDTVDASAVDTGLLGAYHQYYADNQTIISDLFYALRDDPPGQRNRLRQATQGTSIYWRFDPAVR